MKSYIYENITELSCPVGKFSVSCEDKKIPFSIRKNKYDIPYYDITTETNYALDIDTNLLEIKKQYDIVFSEGGCIIAALMNILNHLPIRLTSGLSALVHLI